MNYFETTALEVSVLTDERRAKFPLSSTLLSSYLRMLAIYHARGLKASRWHRGLADFSGMRSLRHPAFLKGKINYALTSRSHDEGARPLLLSATLLNRFPGLFNRLGCAQPAALFVTSESFPMPALPSNVAALKSERLFFGGSVGRRIAPAVLAARAELEARLSHQSIDRGALDEALVQSEQALEERVSEIGVQIAALGTEQFFTALPNRYEDILVALACRRAGLVSKEIVHGVNAHRLEDSDNPIPHTTTLCCVWSQEYAENIASCDRPEDIRVCGYPKYDMSEIKDLTRRHSRKPLICIFSQATYDIGPHYAARVDRNRIEKEKRFRRELFAQTAKLGASLGAKVRIRYHRGERSVDCDRRPEEPILNRLGIEVSTNSFEQDLFESAICVGINTSAIYEAWLLGKEVRQVYFDGSGPRYRELPSVPVERLADDIETLPVADRPIDPSRFLDVPAFLAER